LNDAYAKKITTTRVSQILNYGFARTDPEGSQIGYIQESKVTKVLGLFARKPLPNKSIIGHFQGEYSFAMDEKKKETFLIQIIICL
jgi:hypothetical protein